MTCQASQDRVVGDILAKFTVQLKQDGTPVDLTGKNVTIIAYDDDGNIVIAEDDANITISNAALGYVDYDFQLSDYTDAIAAFASDPTLESFPINIFFKMYEGVGTEPDTFPQEEGYRINIINPAYDRTTPDPSAITTIDIATLAKAPRRTRTVEGTVEERSINDLIKADQYLKQQDAADVGVPWGMRLAKTKPPSTLS
jgi:hypothetical protein